MSEQVKTQKGKVIFHEADSRGLANHGWLFSRHTFSFANYFNPERVNFGALRVINDDIVKPGMGFGTHPHNNMEIISIPLRGALEHKDSTGNTEVIKTGEVQIMSAGSGLTHSEYNHSKTEEVNFLQIWVFPKEKNIEPRYEQKMFDLDNNVNRFVNVVAPDNASAVWINQDAWFSLGKFDEGHIASYRLNRNDSGAYILIIEGSAKINDRELNEKDGLGLTDINELSIESISNSKILIMEVPMNYEA
ncbi:MAG TPA: hypothetical protein DDY13_00400 [Cytophagales bacterium]|jgi:redox-sensitive bicupin YhaK (pirin superfamily)|nr:hypothetical protein [Cytophagales bacterium]